MNTQDSKTLCQVLCSALHSDPESVFLSHESQECLLILLTSITKLVNCSLSEVVVSTVFF